MTSRSQIDVFVGSQVQLHRTLMKMSRAELSMAVSVGEEQLALYETGIARFPPDVLLSVADALGRKISEFFRTVEQQSLIENQPSSGSTQTRAQQEAALNLAFSRLGDADRASVLAYVYRLGKS